MKSYNVSITLTARLSISDDDLQILSEASEISQITPEAAATMKNLKIDAITKDNADQWLPPLLGKALRDDIRDAFMEATMGDFKGLQVSGGVTPRKKVAADE